MGVFGAIGGALKAPVKAVNKVGKAAMKPAMGAANKMMGKAPGMNAMGAAGAAIGNKMGLGPSKPPMNPAMGAPMGGPVPPTTPTSMNPMNSANEPESMNSPSAMGAYNGSRTGGPAVAMNDAGPSFQPMQQMYGAGQAMNEVPQQQNEQFAPPAATPMPEMQPQGIGPSFGQQMNPQNQMGRRRQMMG